MKNIRFGVIGIGGIGRTHIEAIKKTENAEILAIADIDAGMAKKVGEEFKVEYYTDYKKMLGKKEIDAVSICTPHFLHAPMTINALKEGKHVLCEKPIANHVKEADEMVNVAEKSGLKLGVIADGVVDPNFRKVKSMLDNGELGEVYRADILQGGIRTQPYYLRADWRGTWKWEGGACMINQAIHMIDLLPFYLGKPKEVYGWIGLKCHEIEAEDMASALILFENDVPGIVQCNNLENPPVDRITLLTDRAKIVGDWLRSVRIEKHETGLKDYIKTTEEIWGQLKHESIEMGPSKEGFGGIHPKNIAAFVDSVVQDKDPIFSADDARTTLEIINAITLSHFRERAVTLPLNRAEYVNLFEQLARHEKKL